MTSASMLLRILAGLSPVQRGRLRLAGVPHADDRRAGWARRVGYVGAEAGHLSVDDAARGARPGRAPRRVRAGAERRRRIDAVAEQYRLGPRLDEPVPRGGPPLAQRVALAAAMLTDPEVLLLDDPLRSLEPDERARLLAVPGRRRTVVLASRYPASEEGLVNQVAFLRDGRLLRARPPSRTWRHAGLPLSHARDRGPRPA